MQNGKYQIGAMVAIEERHRHKILSELDGMADIEFLGGSELVEKIDKFDIIFGNPPKETLKRAVNLKLLQLNSAGADTYSDMTLFANGGVILANASGAYGLSISEAMLGMHLMLIRKFHLYRDNQSQRNWKSEGKVSSVQGSTVLCAGVGDIGSSYAKKVKALGAYVIGIRRTAADKPDFLDEVYTQDELGSIIGRADVVAMSLPNTGKTQHFLDREMLEKMKNTAYIINVGRGSAIDTDALCDMLENGLLAGAALDVTDPEPLPPDHRLWKIRNAFITPHVSGGYSLDATREMIVDIGTKNIIRFIKGLPLPRTVNMEESY